MMIGWMSYKRYGFPSWGASVLGFGGGGGPGFSGKNVIIHHGKGEVKADDVDDAAGGFDPKQQAC